MNNEITSKNINELLLNRNWTLSENKSKYDIYLPPENLNFEKSYKLFIYNKSNFSDYEAEIMKILEVLAQLYKEDPDELASIVIEDRQILSLHVSDDGQLNERPSIPFFDNLIHKAKELLQENANFAVMQQAHLFDKCEESERYLNYCNFFKNDRGSLITKIQLPNKEEIKESNLFNKPITGNSINDRLIQITKFINDEIITSGNYEPDDQFLLKNKDNISVNVSGKLRELYLGVDLADMEITLNGTEKKRTTFVKNLNKESVENLSKFSKLIRERMKEIIEEQFVGKIIKLESKDIESDKNKVMISAEIKKVKKNLLVYLDSDDYQTAIEAHKNNKSVLVNGTIEKEKTQYKVTELKSFKKISE